MAMVLNDEETYSASDLNLWEVNRKIKAKMAKQETTFEDYKEKYRIQSEIVTELREKNEEVTKLTPNMKALALERVVEKKNFEGKIIYVEVVAASAEDKTDKVKALKACAEMVSRI